MLLVEVGWLPPPSYFLGSNDKREPAGELTILKFIGCGACCFGDRLRRSTRLISFEAVSGKSSSSVSQLTT